MKKLLLFLLLINQSIFAQNSCFENVDIRTIAINDVVYDEAQDAFYEAGGGAVYPISFISRFSPTGENWRVRLDDISGIGTRDIVQIGDGSLVWVIPPKL